MEANDILVWVLGIVIFVQIVLGVIHDPEIVSKEPLLISYQGVVYRTERIE